MAEIVNLRRVKKARAAQEAADVAAANRAKHGRTPAEREIEAAVARQREHRLDGARIETDEEANPRRTS